MPTLIPAAPPSARLPANEVRANAPASASPAPPTSDAARDGGFARVMARAAERDSHRPSAPASEAAVADSSDAATATPGQSAAAEATATPKDGAPGGDPNPTPEGHWAAGIAAAAPAILPQAADAAGQDRDAGSPPGRAARLTQAAVQPDALQSDAPQPEQDAVAPQQAPRARPLARGPDPDAAGKTARGLVFRPPAAEPSRAGLPPQIQAAAVLERRIEAALPRAEPSPAASHAVARASDPAAVHGLLSPTAPASYTLAHAGISAAPWQPQFAEQLAQRVLMFTAQRVQVAELALNPADLGPVSVSIEVRGTETTLAFGAAHAATRAAIEEALPRLREMLSGHGLQLANASVGDQPRRAWSGPQPRSATTLRVEHAAGLDAVGRAATPAVGRAVRLIDVVV